MSATHPHTTYVITLDADTRLHVLAGEHNSFLLVRSGRSLMIECHSAQAPRWIKHHKLPLPDMILHTHVQPEHCREGDGFGAVPIRVPAGAEVLAFDRERYDRESRTVWEKPEEWMVTGGREAFGVAGSVTMLPPEKPLPRIAGAEPLRVGESITWQGLQLDILSAPIHTPHAIALVLRDGQRALAVFTGDLLHDGGTLVNMHDLEHSYGGTRLKDAPAVLNAIADLGADLFLPSTGPLIADGPAQARLLARRINEYQAAISWQSGRFTSDLERKYESVGRYHRVAEGIYQITNFGNVILFIDKQGRGLMVDPGPCDFERPKLRWTDFTRDLEIFEKQCGLKRIEVALITHIHGDHYDMTRLVKERYPGCRTAAWDLVARVIESPWDYPYAALLPWYHIGIEHAAVDDVLLRTRPYFWNDIRIDTVHLPGHCYAHGGHVLEFNGMKIAITGDTIQSRGGSDAMGFIISNHSVPDDKSGNLAAYRALAGRGIELNIGGHGSRFWNADAMYVESIRRIEHAMPFVKALVPGGDLERAFLRTWFPRIQPVD